MDFTFGVGLVITPQLISAKLFFSVTDRARLKKFNKILL
jgi:hypothetical protein